MSKVFFITGAGRGPGVDIARQALAAGHRVVATGRRPHVNWLNAYEPLLFKHQARRVATFPRKSHNCVYCLDWRGFE